MNVMPVKGLKPILSPELRQENPKTTAKVTVRFLSLEETRSEPASGPCFPQRALLSARARVSVRFRGSS